MEINKYCISEREMEVLKELAQGKINKEIARELFIEEKTVKFHMSNLFKKCGIGFHGRVKLVILFIKHPERFSVQSRREIELAKRVNGVNYRMKKRCKLGRFEQANEL